MSHHLESGVIQAKGEMAAATVDHYRMRAEAIRQSAGAGDEEWDVRSQTAPVVVDDSGIALVYQVNYRDSVVQSVEVSFWSTESREPLGDVAIGTTGEVSGSVHDDSAAPDYEGPESLLDEGFMTYFEEYKRLVDGFLGLGERAAGISTFADEQSITLAAEFLDDLALATNDTVQELETV
jgi:hypothetical protein